MQTRGRKSEKGRREKGERDRAGKCNRKRKNEKNISFLSVLCIIPMYLLFIFYFYVYLFIKGPYGVLIDKEYSSNWFLQCCYLILYLKCIRKCSMISKWRPQVSLKGVVMLCSTFLWRDLVVLFVPVEASGFICNFHSISSMNAIYECNIWGVISEENNAIQVLFRTNVWASSNSFFLF